jgi:hypothetical protein
MNLCPWAGLPCDCKAFPFKQNGLIPSQCEALMPDELLGHRAVSEEGKLRYKLYHEEIERTLKNPNKAAK